MSRGAPHVAPTLRDPGVEVGPYRILPRTDGRWIAYDERQPVGRRTAFVGDSEEEVTATARAFHARARSGAPS